MISQFQRDCHELVLEYAGEGLMFNSCIDVAGRTTIKCNQAQIYICLLLYTSTHIVGR